MIPEQNDPGIVGMRAGCQLFLLWSKEQNVRPIVTCTKKERFGSGFFEFLHGPVGRVLLAMRETQKTPRPFGCLLSKSMTSKRQSNPVKINAKRCYSAFGVYGRSKGLWLPELPADHRTGPGETTAKSDEEDDVATFDLALTMGFI